jgi:dipeptidase D
MNALEGLSPRVLWRHFQDISGIPRCSGCEAASAGHVAELASRRGLTPRIDQAGNVIVKKPGLRGATCVALQAHLDMVCEKAASSSHDFSRDPIVPGRDGAWVRASGTSLGADNGIGVAAMLAVMTAYDIVHPDLELIFTVEEETGLAGANALDRASFTAKTLINLDTEEEGFFCIGCAGGVNTELVLEPDFMTVPEGTLALRVRVAGLTGGHSGMDIHRGRPNALKLLARFLHAVTGEYDIHLAEISGGTRHNVIPRDAEALIHASPADMGALIQEAAHWNGIFKAEYDLVDDRVALVIEELPFNAPRIIEHEDGLRAIGLLMAMPHGPIRYSAAWEGVVDTSTNLASCRLSGDEILVHTNQRSITPSALHDAASQVASIGALAGCTVTHRDAYPAWRPNPGSPILGLCRDVYMTTTGREPVVGVVHAGLECAVIQERLKGLDMISIGPTIEGAHSPDERVDIQSVERFWTFLVALLARLSAAAT